MRSIKSILSILIVLIIGGYFCSNYFDKNKFIILDYGNYKVLEKTQTSWRISCIQKTDTIPAILKSWFGFEWISKGFQEVDSIKLKEMVIIPSPGVWDTSLKSFQKEQFKNITFHIGRVGTMIYEFGSKYELVQGIWIFQLWNRNSKVLEKKFYVYFPKNSIK